MPKTKESIVILGGGSWGTAIAHLLASAGHKVHIVLRNEKIAQDINLHHENKDYLPGIPIHQNIKAYAGSPDFFTKKAADIFATTSIIVLSIPCQHLRPILKKIDPFLTKGCIIVNTAKGIEINTLKTVEQIVKDEMVHRISKYAVLSGPSFAQEVIQGKPTAVVVGCHNVCLGEHLRATFSTDWFRVYSSTDVKGVELGGAIKNVIAIAAGVSDALGFGINSQVALVTRGLAEISRLGESLGASPTTFAGLSGLGDLFLTCSDNLSRNRQVGLRIGKGESLSTIIESMKMIAEGIKTAYSTYALAQSKKIDMPITESVYKILEGKTTPHEAVKNLMKRQLKPELENINIA